MGIDWDDLDGRAALGSQGGEATGIEPMTAQEVESQLKRFERDANANPGMELNKRILELIQFIRTQQAWIAELEAHVREMTGKAARAYGEGLKDGMPGK